RRGRRDVAAMAVIALALLPPLAAVAAGTPKSGILFATVAYTLWWASAAGMFAWLALAYGAAVLLAPRAATLLGPRGATLAPRGRGPAARAALALVALAGALVAAGHQPHPPPH